MKLSELLNELRLHQQKWPEYWAYVIQLPKHSSESPDADFDEFPILKIEIEREDKEITFITNRLSTDNSSPPQALTLSQVMNQLLEFETECAEFDLFSGSAIVELSKEYFARQDIPICGFGWNVEDKHFAILHQESPVMQKKKWWQFWK